MLYWIALRKSQLILALVGLFLLHAPAALAETLTIGGTGAALGAMRHLADAYMEEHPDVRISIPESVGSGGGVKAVLAGKFDIGLSSRPLKDKEKQKGVQAAPYARTPFVLAVSSSIGQDIAFSNADVIGIYDRSVATWADGTPLRVILRPESDSDTLKLESRFSGLQPARGAVVAHTDQMAMDLAERMIGAVTTATLTAIIAEQRTLATIAIDGVKPTVENLESGAYGMSKTLSFVVGSETSDVALSFIAFVRSEEGAAVLRDLESVRKVYEGTQ